MKKKLFYQMYPILSDYPVWDGPKKKGGFILPDRQYGLWEMMDEFPKLEELGVDIIWLSGALNSPRKDHGYDVCDFMRIDPRVGTMREPDTFLDFLRGAHKYGMKVIIDLVLNHCSTKHPWFLSRKKDYFYFLSSPKPEWHNLFDDGSAWAYDQSTKMYYLHMFHPDQVDLAWFDENGKLNKKLVDEFRRIVKFWLKEGVDGFRLDVPQSINKDINAEKLSFGDMLRGSKSKEVINAIFDDIPCEILLAECFDPTYGDIMGKYIQETPINYIMNVLVKQVDKEYIDTVIHRSTLYNGYVLDLESHDSCRFPSRPGMTFERELELLFDYGAQNVCLYQGQEFGLKNPTLTREQIIALDAQTAMRLERGGSLERLAPISRANARVPLPDGEYRLQDSSKEETPFKKMKEMIALWKSVS